MYQVRAARAEDEPAIKQLIRETRLNPMGLKWPNFVVAEDEQGQFIGCGQIKTHKNGVRELASIAVVKAWRGRDVATTIIAELLNRATFPLYLMCASHLVPFYEKFTFVEIKDAAAIPHPFRRFRRFIRMLNFFIRSSEYLAIMVKE